MSRRSRRKKIAWAAVAIIFLLSIVVYTADERMKLSPVEIAIRDILAPLQSGATVVSDKVGGAFSYFKNLKELERENERLQRQIAALTEENSLLEEARLESYRLRKLLNMSIETKEEYGEEPIGARVIGRTPGNWLSTITIDKGSIHGLEKDMTVVAPEGLVGRIISVSNRTAEVLLIEDRDGAVGGMLQTSRVPGVVEGTEEDAQLKMIYLPHDTMVRENQVVITSGLHGLFPKGIRIGYVEKVEMEQSGLLKHAIIRPFVDFRRLEEVLVLPIVNHLEEVPRDLEIDVEELLEGSEGN
ncbi:rod shape-determining protein MreC [Desulfitispora alkaliphila]|uniref:rod shape-determining protein MreC n=1 Tax=Desulfitispora alkaliphila TaxID=622674 RepID=UPI003D218BC0